jgi:hypothetical protein
MNTTDPHYSFDEAIRPTGEPDSKPLTGEKHE